MSFAQLDSSRLPVALVVYREDDARAVVAHILRDEGYVTLAVDSLRGAELSLERVKADVVVLDACHDLFTVTKWLVALSQSASAPPVLLVAHDDDVAWIAARFRLLSIDGATRAWSFAQAVRQTVREERRPQAPE
jgi:DNA-binding NtrC family response regulator